MASVSMTIKEIIDDPQTKEIFEKNIPGITAHPALPMTYGMKLNEIATMPQAAMVGLTPEVFAKIQEEFEAL